MSDFHKAAYKNINLSQSSWAHKPIKVDIDISTIKNSSVFIFRYEFLVFLVQQCCLESVRSTSSNKENYGLNQKPKVVFCR
jgi:hypothetical protein